MLDSNDVDDNDDIIPNMQVQHCNYGRVKYLLGRRFIIIVYMYIICM